MDSSYSVEKLIQDKITNNIKFNESDVRTIIRHYIHNYSLEDYVSSISYRVFDTRQASYTALDKVLQINPMLVYLYTLLTSKSSNVNNDYNINMLIIIFHELAHVKQTKQSELPVKTSLDKVIRDSMTFGKRLPYVSKKELSFYHKNASYMLFERSATIEENIGILDLNSEIKILTSDDIFFFNYNIYHTCLSNYQMQNGKLITPSEKFYRLMGDDSFAKIEFDEENDMLTTLEWGMPISTKNFEYLKENAREFIESANIKKKILSLK